MGVTLFLLWKRGTKGDLLFAVIPAKAGIQNVHLPWFAVIRKRRF
jgi:hypothetical protein